jgi:hypothetical protein
MPLPPNMGLCCAEHSIARRAVGYFAAVRQTPRPVPVKPLPVLGAVAVLELPQQHAAREPDAPEDHGQRRHQNEFIDHGAPPRTNRSRRSVPPESPTRGRAELIIYYWTLMSRINPPVLSDGRLFTTNVLNGYCNP